MPTITPSRASVELDVMANFVEVFLAKQGHGNAVGINYMEKLQLATVPSLYGAMLAGVDYVLMGAGIPRAIPGALDLLAKGETVRLRIDVEGERAGEEHLLTFDPKSFGGGTLPAVKRPQFLPIVASATLAMSLAKKSNGAVQGFVVEGPTAGGHNAPPRGPLQLNSAGEPIYSARDVPELEKIRALGLPFWLAGSYGAPGRLAQAKALGAVGIQVGTAFAFCQESGMDPSIRKEVLRLSRSGKASVMTDPLASPTGFPFKVAQVDHTLSDAKPYQERRRICDLGYLRHLYRKDDGSVGYRCPAEPVEDFILKGGTLEQTAGRKCLCNSLPANVGLAQIRSTDQPELPLITAGDDVSNLAQFIPEGCESYTAADVVRAILSPATTRRAAGVPIAAG